MYPNAVAHATKALQLDASLAIAHLALAEVNKAYEWAWTDADEGYRRALVCDSSDPMIYAARGLSVEDGAPRRSGDGSTARASA